MGLVQTISLRLTVSFLDLLIIINLMVASSFQDPVISFFKFEYVEYVGYVETFLRTFPKGLALSKHTIFE